MIYVVGCIHGIQPRDEDWLGGDSPEAKEQKSFFTGLIREILAREDIQFVGEEWGRPEITIAHAIADSHGILWANINTSLHELEEMGIPTNYVTGPYTAEQKAQWHRQREQFMLLKIQQERGEAANLLVVSGFEHMQPMSEVLQKLDNRIKTVDYRLLGWYQPRVFAEDQ